MRTPTRGRIRAAGVVPHEAPSLVLDRALASREEARRATLGRVLE